MTEQSIAATVKLDDGKELVGEFTYDFGDNLQEAIEKFGEEVVYARFKAAVVVDVQGVARRLMSGKEPKKGKALQDAINEWKPGVQRSRKSKTEKALAILEGMSDEERQEFLDSLDD